MAILLALFTTGCTKKDVCGTCQFRVYKNGYWTETKLVESTPTVVYHDFPDDTSVSCVKTCDFAVMRENAGSVTKRTTNAVMHIVTTVDCY